MVRMPGKASQGRYYFELGLEKHRRLPGEKLHETLWDKMQRWKRKSSVCYRWGWHWGAVGGFFIKGNEMVRFLFRKGRPCKCFL